MRKLFIFTLTLILINCETENKNFHFSDQEYKILAYDQILLNFSLPETTKDSLYHILYKKYNVSANKLDSLRIIMVENSPTHPIILSRMKSEIDSLKTKNIYFTLSANNKAHNNLPR